jgi:hypothetical protein
MGNITTFGADSTVSTVYTAPNTTHEAKNSQNSAIHRPWSAIQQLHGPRRSKCLVGALAMGNERRWLYMVNDDGLHTIDTRSVSSSTSGHARLIPVLVSGTRQAAFVLLQLAKKPTSESESASNADMKSNSNTQTQTQPLPVASFNDVDWSATEICDMVQLSNL